MITTRYRVRGINCKSCVDKISNVLTTVDRLSEVEVSLNPPMVKLQSTEALETELMNEVVASVGDYSLTKLDEDVAVELRQDSAGDETEESLYPLLLIVAYILAVVLIIQMISPASTWLDAMRHFMAGFFLVFSFFKLLDLKGFISAFRVYDIPARRSEAWAKSYPFLELLLGVAYLIDFLPLFTNSITLVIMLVGAVGVLQALITKTAIQCACLGTALNLPMTKVTLIEDLLMAAMAALMLFMQSS